MEKFFELFNHDFKIQRLEIRILEPNEQNAKLLWSVLKNENPDDFKYAPMTQHILPLSQQETLELMKYDYDMCKTCGVNWFVFYNNNLIGYQRIYYSFINETIRCASVWFIRKYWGNGFNQELHKKIEEIAFEHLKVNRICRQCIKGNIRSYNSIVKSGYHFDGINRQHLLLPDGTYQDQCLFSKLCSEYKAYM